MSALDWFKVGFCVLELIGIVFVAGIFIDIINNNRKR